MLALEGYIVILWRLSTPERTQFPQARQVGEGTLNLPTHQIDVWRVRPIAPELQDGWIHVWSSPLDVPDSTRRELSESLSRNERDRAHRFAFARDRRRSETTGSWRVGQGKRRTSRQREVGSLFRSMPSRCRRYRTTGFRESISTGRAQSPRYAEVRDHGMVTRKENVVRFDITVQNTHAVSISQCGCDLAGDVERIVHGQLFLPTYAIRQALALDERHNVVHHAVRLARIEQGEDVGVLELPGNRYLAHEPFAADRRRQIGTKHFQRHEAVVLEVAGEVDRCHNVKRSALHTRAVAIRIKREGDRVAPHGVAGPHTSR